MALDFSLYPIVPYYDVERPIDWQKRFDRSGRIDVEIGSGYGDFLLRQAQENPFWDFVGIEQEWERVKKILRKIDQNRMTADAASGQNIRLLQVDATVAFERLFVPRTITKIYCLFPCPWPKKKHIKHRLFSPDFLRLVNSRLVADGEVQIVTDDRPYFLWVLEQLAGTGFRHQTRNIPPSFGTKYERKWQAQGQQEFYELCLFKEQHQDVKLQEDVAMKVYLTKSFFPEKFMFADVLGQPSILMKEFIYDSARQKAMAHFVVAEQTVTQHLWVAVGKCPRGWYIAKAQGNPVIPTEGIARTLALVAQTVSQSGDGSFWAADEPQES